MHIEGVVEFLGTLLGPAQESRDDLPQYVLAALEEPTFRDRVLYEARRNKVLCRSITSLLKNYSSALGHEVRSHLGKTVHDCQRRGQRSLELMSEAQRVLTEAGARFCIFKTVPDFPDLNAEIDVLIERQDIAMADEALRRLNPSHVHVGHWKAELAEKRHYVYHHNGDEYELELYPKFTEFGEDYIVDSEVISRSRQVVIQGTEIRCPIPEDELLITCTHTIYRHGGIVKLSDVYSTASILREGAVDVDFIYHQARNMGVSSGLDVFLSFVCAYYEARTGLEIRPPQLRRRLRPGGHRPIPSSPMAFPYRLPACKMTWLLSRKVWWDLRHRRLRSAYGSARTLAFKVASRILYTLLKLARQERALRWFGWA